ncbi:glycosyltransferase family A protein [Streptococcus hyointestinalis]|uniref:glycosyltransferase family 2 protein n=1 Tax=Streptococcus hyointestinalis TaxID=1337 RepID=UPI0035134945
MEKVELLKKNYPKNFLEEVSLKGVGMQKKILTVVVPSYNAGEFLKETIPTIVEVNNSEFLEVLIVNDGSKDNTLEVAHRLEEKYLGIVRVVDKENGGHGSTINVGIQYAEGKYFKVIDADDWVDTKNFEELINYLISTDDDEVISPYNDVYEDTGVTKEVNYFIKSDIKSQKSYQYDEFLDSIKVLPRMHSITIKTSILRNNNIRIDERMFYVDTEYILFPVPHIETISYTSQPIYQYRRGNENQSTSIQNYIKNRDMLKHVCLAIIDFYSSNTILGSRKKYVEEVILRSIEINTSVLLSMKNVKEAKQEFLSMEEILKNKVPNLFKNPQGRKLKILRKTHYLTFGIMSYFKRKNPSL